MNSTFENLLSTSRDRETELRLMHLLIDTVEPDPKQPRKVLDPAQLTELADSVRQEGVLHPLLVMPANNEGKYQIIAGERRWRAAVQAGLKRVPAFILLRDELGRRRVQLVENLQRVDLNPTERAQHISLMRELASLQAANDGVHLSERDLDMRIGTMLGISDRAVRDFLAVATLPNEAQDVARAHHLSIKHLRAARFVGPDQAEPFMTAVAEAGATGNEALAAARLMRDAVMPVEQALATVRAGAADFELEADLDTPGVATPTLRPQPAPHVAAMPRKRRSVYVRLLETDRMLSRLPLSEAVEPAEAALWARALDTLIARATALRASLRRLEQVEQHEAIDEQ
jgi:ParB family transcriptional regulator, chromosome partitioning protein